MKSQVVEIPIPFLSQNLTLALVVQIIPYALLLHVMHSGSAVLIGL